MFALDYRRLPRLSSWQDCHNHFERKLKDLTARRKNGDTWRETVLPLVKWRDKHLRIERYRPIGEPGYALYYHNDVVVLYFDDGRVRFDASWDSPSTRSFFEMLAPSGWRIARSTLPATVIERVTRGRGAFGYCRREEWHSVERDAPLEVAADGTVKNPRPFEYRKKLANTPQRKRIREKLKDFEQWYCALSRCGGSLAAVAMDDGVLTKLVLSGCRPFQMIEDTVERLLHEPNDEEIRRAAVSWALLCVDGGIYAFGGDFAKRYRLEVADRVLKKIYATAWERADGWREEVVVVPAGERP